MKSPDQSKIYCEPGILIGAAAISQKLPVDHSSRNSCTDVGSFRLLAISLTKEIWVAKSLWTSSSPTLQMKYSSSVLEGETGLVCSIVRTGISS